SKQPNHHCEIVCSCGCPYVHIETIFRYIRICIPHLCSPEWLSILTVAITTLITSSRQSSRVDCIIPWFLYLRRSKSFFSNRFFSEWNTEEGMDGLVEI
ncbi:hypothetical protein PFISCL1PPCAC_5995, partial [Pristionchus fissidentatus]